MRNVNEGPHKGRSKSMCVCVCEREILPADLQGQKANSSTLVRREWVIPHLGARVASLQ